MPAPKNQFKAALKAGNIQIGCWLGLADSYCAEIAASAGFDWLLVDGEHAPNDLRSILTQLQIIEKSPSNAAVRLPIGETWMIKQFLDAGAQTILIPMVESAAQAKELVKACHYPPMGVRGVGSSLARASNFGDIADYLTTAGDEICLLVQVESQAGLDALDEILAVDGIDGVFIGPADLAADMGYLGKPKEPKVIKAIEDAIVKIAASDKAAGILTLDETFARRCMDLGATFVAVGIDVTAYANAMRSLAATYKT
ncbi:4-hydroxy-2-oxoheptanedioate aldolase [Maritalea sp.]|jgi:4-hydroxy-2-oxoheptanedioate aldolase|uniref:4-hydroxy-2-oxoheptanedioate aldolase n=1 Tax=Maritalea sp. TaxID=2003361 RepID=UPI0039E49B63